MEGPLVGAVVEVTLTGEVRCLGEDGSGAGGGFWLRYPSGLRRPWWARIPDSAPYTVLTPARPCKVLLLECGHLAMTDTMMTAPLGALSGAYCLRCERWEPQTAVGSVTW